MDEHHLDVLLCRATYTVQSIKLCVSLYAHCVGTAFLYELEICQGQERVCCEAGTDPEVAHRLFSRILSGGVTACHLHDVVGDELFVQM